MIILHKTSGRQCKQNIQLRNASGFITGNLINLLGSISWYLFSENTNHNCPTFILRFDNIHIWFQFNLDIVLLTIEIGMGVSRSVLKSLILSASTISSLPCCDTSSLSFLLYLFTTFRSLSILTGADLFSKDISFRSVVWKIGRILFLSLWEVMITEQCY